MNLKLCLGSLLSALSMVLLLSTPVSASCHTRRRSHSPYLLQHRHRHHSNQHHPMSYYYPVYGRSNFGAMMNEIFSMPTYFNSLMRQQEEQISRFRHSLTGVPQYEITEGDDTLELAIDVTGARPADLNVQLEEGGKLLRVTGSRYHRRANGQLTSYEFDQTFAIDDDDHVDVEKMSASLSNGILRVTAPKMKETRDETRKLPIMYGNEEETDGDALDNDEAEESISSESQVDDDSKKKTIMEKDQHDEVPDKKEKDKTIGVEEIDGLTITEDE